MDELADFYNSSSYAGGGFQNDATQSFEPLGDPVNLSETAQPQPLVQSPIPIMTGAAASTQKATTFTQMPTPYTQNTPRHFVQESSQGATGESEKKPDTIRIVIRDAKPPLFARILQGTMHIICLVMLLAVCAIGVPRLFGVYEFNVMTGSMTPTYPVGTLVYVAPKDPSSIRPGEVVTCVMDANLNVITHRVVENNYDENTIVTKGDANEVNDSPILYENVVGVVCFAVPEVGGFVDYLTNNDQGRILAVGVILGIVALTFLAEGIASVLTRQAANVYANAGDATTGNGKRVKVKTHKARWWNR